MYLSLRTREEERVNSVKKLCSDMCTDCPLFRRPLIASLRSSDSGHMSTTHAVIYLVHTDAPGFQKSVYFFNVV